MKFLILPVVALSVTKTLVPLCLGQAPKSGFIYIYIYFFLLHFILLLFLFKKSHLYLLIQLKTTEGILCSLRLSLSHSAEQDLPLRCSPSEGEGRWLNRGFKGGRNWKRPIAWGSGSGLWKGGKPRIYWTCVEYRLWDPTSMGSQPASGSITL